MKRQDASVHKKLSGKKWKNKKNTNNKNKCSEIGSNQVLNKKVCKILI